MMEGYKIVLKDHFLTLEGYGLALVGYESAENLNELISNELISNLQEAQSRDVLRAKTYVTANSALGTALDYRYGLNHDPTDLDQAAAAYQRAAEATKQESDKIRYYEKAADSQYQLGVALTQDGQWYEGLAALEASLATYRDAHSRLGRADALQQMGRTHYLMSNFDKARIHFRDALRMYQAEDSLPGQAACHTGLGRLMLRLNFIDDAIAELRQACHLYTQLNDEARLSEVQQVYDLAQKVKAKQPLAATLSPPSP
jgi:tetratricopeptide (TPR) repeat protein